MHAVVVGFSRTSDGHNPWRGATFAGRFSNRHCHPPTRRILGCGRVSAPTLDLHVHHPSNAPLVHESPHPPPLPFPPMPLHRHSQFVSQGEGVNPRFFTPRECARIMGFPDSFKTACSTVEPNRFYHQIGNAVCPPVIKAIIEMVLPVLTAGRQL